jgi:hypothetical protein
MNLRYLYYALWSAPVPVFVCLAVMLRRRKLHQQMPLFFAFVIFQFIDFTVTFYSYHRSQLEFFYAYFALAAVSMALGFGVLYEVFSGVFRPLGELRHLGAVLFRWATLVLVLAATLVATTATAAAGNRIFATILNLERSVEVMQCGMVLLILLCSSYLGLTLRHRIFGIALGFGLMAAVDLIAVTVRATLGYDTRIFAQLVKMVAYNLSALLWVGYVYAGRVAVEPAKRLAHAERWDYALAAVLHPGIDAPALPLIEDVVERVWAQANGNSHGDEVRSQNASQ